MAVAVGLVLCSPSGDTAAYCKRQMLNGFTRSYKLHYSAIRLLNVFGPIISKGWSTVTDEAQPSS